MYTRHCRLSHFTMMLVVSDKCMHCFNNNNNNNNVIYKVPYGRNFRGPVLSVCFYAADRIAVSFLIVLLCFVVSVQSDSQIGQSIKTRLYSAMCLSESETHFKHLVLTHGSTCLLCYRG